MMELDKTYWDTFVNGITAMSQSARILLHTRRWTYGKRNLNEVHCRVANSERVTMAYDSSLTENSRLKPCTLFKAKKAPLK